MNKYLIVIFLFAVACGGIPIYDSYIECMLSCDTTCEIRDDGKWQCKPDPKPTPTPTPTPKPTPPPGKQCHLVNKKCDCYVLPAGSDEWLFKNCPTPQCVSAADCDCFVEYNWKACDPVDNPTCGPDECPGPKRNGGAYQLRGPILHNHTKGKTIWDVTPAVCRPTCHPKEIDHGRMCTPFAGEGVANSDLRERCELEAMGGPKPDWQIRNVTGSVRLVDNHPWFGIVVGRGTYEIRACYPNGRACTKKWKWHTRSGGKEDVVEDTEVHCDRCARIGLRQED